MRLSFWIYLFHLTSFPVQCSQSWTFAFRQRGNQQKILNPWSTIWVLCRHHLWRSLYGTRDGCEKYTIQGHINTKRAQCSGASIGQNFGSHAQVVSSWSSQKNVLDKKSKFQVRVQRSVLKIIVLLMKQIWEVPKFLFQIATYNSQIEKKHPLANAFWLYQHR